MEKGFSQLTRYIARRAVNRNGLKTRSDSLTAAIYHNNCWKSSVRTGAIAEAAATLSSTLPPLLSSPKEKVCKLQITKATAVVKAKKGVPAASGKNPVACEKIPFCKRRGMVERPAGSKDASEKDSHAKKASGKHESGNNGSTAGLDTFSRGLSSVRLTEAILHRLCFKPEPSTLCVDKTDVESENDLSDFIKEATTGTSSTFEEICNSHGKNAVEGGPLVKNGLTYPKAMNFVNTTDVATDNVGPSISNVYKERLSSMFVNAFSGKMTPLNSRVAKELFKLGFRQHSGNPLQLEWSPRIFVRECYYVAMRLWPLIKRKMHSNKADGEASGSEQDVNTSLDKRSPREIGLDDEGRGVDNNLLHLTDRTLNFMLKKFENTKVSWRQDLAKLMRRPDALTAVGEELNRRYMELSGSYMPAKLDASPDPAVNGLKLTPDQTNVMQLALRGYHIYIGGSAGTGKTVLLKVIFHRLTELGLHVAMTASTGVAAVQLGGCTFHRAFSVPIDAYNLGRCQHWDGNALRAVDVVIIDEVSLLEASMFDAFDMESRVARMNPAPFGGMQIIVCGDFMQLSNDSAYDALPVYMSDAFKHLLHVKLVTPMRHSASDPLLCLLNQLRRGKYCASSFEALDRPIPPDAREVTYIFPRRCEAQRLNEEKLSALTTTEMTFTPQRGPLFLFGQFTPSAFIGFSSDVSVLPSRAEVVRVVQEEALKAFPNTGPLSEHSCVVMPGRTPSPSLLLRWRCTDGREFSSDTLPSPQKLVSRGGCSKNNAAGMQTKEGWAHLAEQVAARLRGRLLKMFEVEPTALVPLSVSMALADTTDRDIAEAMLPLRLKLGCRVMVNRNLSRTVSNGSVGVVEAFLPPDPNLFPHRTDTAACSVYRRVLSANLFAQLPVVRLLSGEVVQIPPISNTLGGSPTSYYYGYEAFTLPLQLGYGFTVHKVQGLTLQGTVVLDCKSFFNCPHLIYVACSRVRHIDQLIVRNIRSKMVIVKQSALEFSDSLKPADDARILVVPPHAPRAAWTLRTNPRILRC